MLEAVKALVKGLARRFEGWRARPYLCPAGVATVAYGSTAYPDGRKVTLQDPPVTREAGEAMLDHDVDAFARLALALSPNLRGQDERHAAIADFIYNLGPARYRASTLRRKVRDGDWEEAAEEFAKWVWGGGRKLPGLVLRRAAEAELFRRARTGRPLLELTPRPPTRARSAAPARAEPAPGLPDAPIPYLKLRRAA